MSNFGIKNFKKQEGGKENLLKTEFKYKSISQIPFYSQKNFPPGTKKKIRRYLKEIGLEKLIKKEIKSS